MKDLRVWLGILVSVAATAILLSMVNPWETIAVLQRTDPLLLTLYILAIPLAMWLKSHRWRLLFPRPEQIQVGGLIEVLYLGYMVNAIMPLRIGELVRVFLVAQTQPTSRSTSLATILTEKVLDVGTMALILVLLGQIFPNLPDSARAVALMSGLGMVVAIIGVACALLARSRARILARWCEARVPLLAKIGAAKMLDAFLDGLAFAQRPKLLVRVTLWTLAVWGLDAVSIALGLLAVGITGTSVAELVVMTLLLLVVMNLSMAIPSAPGYLGVFHGVFVATLVIFHIREEQAVAAAVLAHGLVFGFFILGGVYYLLRGQAMRASGRQFSDLLAGARSAAPGAP